MNRQSLSLGRVYGIPVGIDYSWFLVFVLVTWTLATSYFPTEFKNWTAVEYWVVSGVTAFLFFFSVLLHELGHSLVAKRFKIPVEKITLYIFGGISEIKAEPETASAEFWITLAGPAVNLILAGILAALAAAISPAASTVSPLLAVLKYLAYINLILGVFNLLPGFPLDGGSVLMAVIWLITHKKHWGILAAGSVGSLIAYVLIFAGVFQVIGGGVISGLWTAFLGWFMLNASGSAVRRERLQELLTGHTVAEAMSRGYVVIYADTSLQTLFDEHILGSGGRSYIVTKDNRVVGLLTMHALRKIPKESWPETTVEQVMIPLAEFRQIDANTGIWDALEEMDRDGVNQLPVMTGDQIQGMLTREDVISYLRSLQPARRS